MPRIKKKLPRTPTFHRDDLVLARVIGYPKWPAMVVRGSQMPDDVRNAFARSDKTYAVRFMPDADYYFFNASGLEVLDDTKIEVFLRNHKNAPSKRPTKGLREAYLIARDDPISWARRQDSIVEQARAIAELAAASDQDASNSGEEVEEEEEEEEEDEVEHESEAGGEEEAEAVASGASETEEAAVETEESPVPVRRRAARRELNAKRQSRADIEDEAETEALLEPEARRAKRARNGRVSKARTSTATEPENASLTVATADPEASMTSNEVNHNLKKVKIWRFELQRIFLGKEGIILDAMQRANEQFAMLEAHTITLEELAHSKVNKALKRIIAIKPQIPASVEEQYNFTARAEKLLQEWHQRLGVL